ncbi:hypothetical protein EKE94_03170 [Mesobaculum littorinae]|uniref:Uncharacterized protein n=1 Tax=Mesobaculum littorinae TaxID=2486419 RepID=A0A438AMV5_9RHOB|nr:hypothetical protein EKE94_03170 [Mesobaculum littorinae]
MRRCPPAHRPAPGRRCRCSGRTAGPRPARARAPRRSRPRPGSACRTGRPARPRPRRSPRTRCA